MRCKERNGRATHRRGPARANGAGVDFERIKAAAEGAVGGNPRVGRGHGGAAAGVCLRRRAGRLVRGADALQVGFRRIERRLERFFLVLDHVFDFVAVAKRQADQGDGHAVERFGEELELRLRALVVLFGLHEILEVLLADEVGRVLLLRQKGERRGDGGHVKIGRRGPRGGVRKVEAHGVGEHAAAGEHLLDQSPLRLGLDEDHEAARLKIGGAQRVPRLGGVGPAALVAVEELAGRGAAVVDAVLAAGLVRVVELPEGDVGVVVAALGLQPGPG